MKSVLDKTDILTRNYLIHNYLLYLTMSECHIVLLSHKSLPLALSSQEREEQFSM